MNLIQTRITRISAQLRKTIRAKTRTEIVPMSITLKKRLATVLIASGLGVAFSPIAAFAVAEDKKQHWVTGAVSVEVQNDGTFHSDNPDNQRNDLYATIEPGVTAHFTPEFSFTAHAVFEPVREPDPGKPRYFDGHGLYVDELHLDYRTDRFALFGGKFTPNFGKAWDTAPGIYGTDFAEDYELVERVGFGGSVKFASEETGVHSLAVNLFFLDTSPLSGAIITSRHRIRKNDGGPSNTESPISVSAAIEGALPAPTELTYHIGFVSQAKGEGNTADERGLVFGLSRNFKARATTVTPMAEYVHFWNADATADQSRDYLTTGVRLGIHSWNTAAVYSLRKSDYVASPDTTDWMFQLSAGYGFPFGMTLDLGWRMLDEDGTTSHTIGTLLTYNLEFALLKK